VKDCIVTQKKVFRVRPTTKVVAMWDWDGTFADTMPAHADLAAMCINAHFGMNLPEAREKYLSTTGVPFDRQLEKIFPKSTSSQREACAKEYHERKMTYVYGNPKDFPQVAKVIKRLRNHPNIIQVISSSTEESIINEWVKKTGNDMYMVLGRESGSKKDHISIIKKEFPNAIIVFVSDSYGDMSLPVDMTFGVDVPTDKNALFLDNGAAIVSRKPVCLVWAEYCFGKIGLVV
jgi:phosphoglycolate phosphatase-like HAD superfamily hydrolase